MTISIISVCKTRLEHLKQSIPSWKQLQPEEIIVVDVSCPDQTKDWLSSNHPDVKCVSLVSKYFNLAQARNIGAKNATSDYLFFVDADIILQPEFCNWFKFNKDADSYFRRFQVSPTDGIHEQGSCLCNKKHFYKIYGYDEFFRGYGGEDQDFYYRLNRIGVGKKNIPKEYFHSLEHSDEKRTENYQEKNKLRAAILNRSYSAIKMKLLEQNPRLTELPKSMRQQVRNEVELALPENFSKLESNLTSINLTKKAWLPEPYFLEITTQINFKVSRRAK